MKTKEFNLEEDLFEDEASEDLFLGLTDDEILERIDTEYSNSYDFRKPVIKEWHMNEALLYGKKPETLSKRSNIMIQLMAGFEDTLLSKIKQPISLVFTPTEGADTIKARKTTRAWELESSVTKEDWEYKDLLVKKLAMVSGRGILKIMSADPYAHRLDPIDHYDFLVDPLTNGMSLESARYLGQDNIILSKHTLEKGDYIKERVEELIASYAEDNSEIPDNEDDQKANRFVVAGLDYDDYFQAGDASYKLLEWYTTINGVRAVILLDREKRIIIRKEKLSEITGELVDGEQPFWPFESWAYYPDLFNFWSPSPMSRVREIYILRNVSLNQMFDNNEAKNRPMRAFDTLTYKNPSMLKYEPDKNIPVAAGRDPSKGLHTFVTPDIIEPKQFNDILENLAGKISGVTASGAGDSQEKKVGIYYGDQQEIEKRMTLFEISYNRAHLRLGQKYLRYISDRLDKDTSIRILGEDGVEFEDLKKDDLAKFDLVLTGGLTQAANDAIEKKTKNDYLSGQKDNQLFNQKFLIELGMAMNGFNKDDIKRALDPVDKNEKQVIRASQDIQDILLGKEVKKFMKADTSYLSHIFDYVAEKELSPKDEDALVAHLERMRQIVTKNMVSKARSESAQRGLLEKPDISGAQQQQQQPGINSNIVTQGGLDQSRSQEVPAESQKTYDR